MFYNCLSTMSCGPCGPTEDSGTTESVSERKGFRGPGHLVSEADWKPGTAWHCQNASEPEPPK